MNEDGHQLRLKPSLLAFGFAGQPVVGLAVVVRERRAATSST